MRSYDTQSVKIEAGRDVSGINIKQDIGQYYETPDVMGREIGLKYCLIDRGAWLERFSNLLHECENGLAPVPRIVFFAARPIDRSDLLLNRLTLFGWGPGHLNPMRDMLQTDVIPRTRAVLKQELSDEDLTAKLMREFAAGDLANDSESNMRKAPLRLWIQLSSRKWDRTTQRILHQGVEAFLRLARERDSADALMICCMELRGWGANRQARSFVSFWEGQRDQVDTGVHSWDLERLTEIVPEDANFWVSNDLDPAMHATMLNAISKCYRRFGLQILARQRMSLASLTEAIDRFRREGWFTGVRR